MNPQANIDTEAIREALQRRAQGMGGTPQVSQMTAPMGSLPTGGFNTPVNPTPQPSAPSPMGTNIPPRQTGAIMKGAQATQGPAFDDETKLISKALIKKLLDVV